MHAYLAEFLGTALLVLLGNGVVANVVLPKTKGNGAGWIVIAFGWGMAVFVAVRCVDSFSGAHLNPAVTVGLAAAGNFSWSLAPAYIVAQMVGALVGAVLVFVFYRDHYAASDDGDAKLATFATAPAIRNYPNNLFSEVIGTMVLVLAALLAVDPSITMASGAETNQTGTLKLGLGARGRSPWDCLCCRSAFPWAERRVTQSTRPATSARESLTSCCQYRASATAIGVTPGFRWSVHCWGQCWR